MNWDNVPNGVLKKSEFAPRDWSTGKLVNVDNLNWDMHSVLIGNLFDLRILSGYRLIVHPNGGFSLSGHTNDPPSLHYGWQGDNLGRATDFHLEKIKGKPIPIIEQAVLTFKYTNNCSIGMYPYWNSPGLHVDYREGTGKKPMVWYRDRGGLYHFYVLKDFYKCLTDVIVDMGDTPKIAA